MAHRLEMDDWPMELVSMVEKHDKSRVDHVFQANELIRQVATELPVKVEAVYFVHAHKRRSGACAGMLFIIADQVYKPYMSPEIDALLDAFSLAVHENKKEVWIHINGKQIAEEQEPKRPGIRRDSHGDIEPFGE